MEAVASTPSGPAWKASLGLSTRRAPELYETSEQVGNAPHAGALRTAFDDLSVSAVFCVQHVPTVAIVVDEFDRAATASLHAALWNQGLASLLVVVSGETFRIFSLSRFPRSGDDGAFDTCCLVDKLDAVTHALALRNLVYATESGRFWEEHRDKFDPRERVDQVLLDNLTESHRLLCDTGLSTEAAQALLVQTTFIAYLEDREIIGAKYVRSATNTPAGSFEELPSFRDCGAGTWTAAPFASQYSRCTSRCWKRSRHRTSGCSWSVTGSFPRSTGRRFTVATSSRSRRTLRRPTSSWAIRPGRAAGANAIRPSSGATAKGCRHRAASRRGLSSGRCCGICGKTALSRFSCRPWAFCTTMPGKPSRRASD